MAVNDAERLPPWLGWSRLAVGLAQGVGLYALSELRLPQLTPLQAAAWVTLWFIPVLVVGGLGALRCITLIVWTIVAAALAAGLAWYDVARLPEGEPAYVYGHIVYVIAPMVLFVGHHLVAAGDEARKLVAPYERYFDLGWRHGAQLVLAILFTGAFWAVVLLGAALFKLIGITFLQELVNKTWFSFPATCTMFALAIHLTDLRSGLVRGARALGLVLLSWLLPAMAGLAAAFFVALPFTGLEPLWATRAATTILLSAAATLVVLVNAAYQDGEHKANIILRWSARLASLLMTPLAVLAAYALYLRIDQYGLTPERVYALAVLTIGSCYAVAYAIGAFWPRWMKPLEIGNIASAVVVLATAIALFSPIADPARLSVEDQLRRLASGRTAPDKLDVQFLRFEGARYGQAALRRLTHDRSDATRTALADRAQAALDQHERWAPGPDYAQQQERPLVITMHPQGAALPEGLGGGDPRGQAISYLCADQMNPCDGYLVDVNSDGEDEILLGRGEYFWLYGKSQGGEWISAGSLQIDTAGQDVLRRGEARVVPSLVGDLMLGERRVVLQRDYGSAWPGPDAPNGAAARDAPSRDR